MTRIHLHQYALHGYKAPDMRKFIFTAILFTLIFQIQTSAYAANGAALYSKNCTACHGTEMFTRPDRRANNLAALKNRVRRCSYTLETRWFGDEVNAVTGYLNKTFYKF